MDIAEAAVWIVMIVCTTISGIAYLWFESRD